jgi:hypothetical protein
MARIPLGKLETALSNPIEFRRAMASQGTASFGETFAGALRQAIHRYHGVRDSRDAMRYLEQRLQNSPRLRNRLRRQETLEQLDWYIREHQSVDWPTFVHGYRVVVPIPGMNDATGLTCSGEITRIDIVPTGGYALWLASTSLELNWQDELRFPLMQDTVAVHVLGVPTSEVSVGVCDLRVRRIEQRTFTPTQLTRARRRFGQLIRALGF